MDMAAFVDGIVAAMQVLCLGFLALRAVLSIGEGLGSRGQPDHGQADRPNDVGREAVFERH